MFWTRLSNLECGPVTFVQTLADRPINNDHKH